MRSALTCILTISDLPTQHWRAMREIDQLIIIIPVVLNLKGNLEMNLSARLGTAANVGELDEPKRRRRMILGNLALLQVQAMVVSFVAACFAILLGLIVHPLPESAPLIAQPSSNSTAPSLLMRDLFLYSRKPIPHPHPEAKHTTDLATYVAVLYLTHPYQLTNSPDQICYGCLVNHDSSMFIRPSARFFHVCPNCPLQKIPSRSWYVIYKFYRALT